ncbi:uncharacterized protein LOC100176328 isoform X1 [Ciona intestinalis]
MKVIVAGFSKTGTKTMQAALTDLGYNVYDYSESFEFLEKEWKQICTVGGSTELFRKMYENVDAITDLPGCAFWDEILKAFPDAKIILTMRDNEEQWWQSLLKQHEQNTSLLLKILFTISPTGRRMGQHGSRIISAIIGQEMTPLTNVLNETLFKMAYRRHNAHVLQNAPKDQLLVFNFKDGWEPLCKFLGVPVPDTPFHHKNKKGAIIKEMLQTNNIILKIQREAMVVAAVSGVLAAIGLYKGISLARRVNWGDMFTTLGSLFKK